MSCYLATYSEKPVSWTLEVVGNVIQPWLESSVLLRVCVFDTYSSELGRVCVHPVPGPGLAASPI